jgi:hypothetical protein
MVRALCDVGDRLIVAEGPPTNAFDPGFSLELFFLIRPLLQKLAEPDRATLLFDCAKNSEGAITIVSMTAFLGHEHGRNGGRAEMAALPAEKKRFMSIDADRLEQQVKLAYDFIDALHRQALGLIKDVETQVGEAAEALESFQSGGGYRFIVNRMSSSLATPQPAIANYYAAFFKQFPEHKRGPTPVDEHTPPIAFVMVVLRERGMDHPEVRFGVLTAITRAAGRDDWPRTVEQIPSHVDGDGSDRWAPMGR